ncbi:MAG: hypothetical protein ACXWJZ_12780 [Burkholderiaceae bacterium]
MASSKASQLFDGGYNWEEKASHKRVRDSIRQCKDSLTVLRK